MDDSGTDRRRPERTASLAGGSITRSVILQAALDIVDSEGMDALSMRRLGKAVGRDTTVLYRHVPNKGALLDGVVETMLAQLPVDTADPDWLGQLRTVGRRFRELALAHPNAVPLLVTRPLSTPLGRRPPGMLRPLEDTIALLVNAGFAAVEALHVYRLLFDFLYGHVLHELQELVDRPDETDDFLRLGLHRLPLADFPHLRALAPALAAYDGSAELDRGLDLLLHAIPEPAPPAP